ncbi:MAG TPA: ankyrin repeat domain-containing protein [Candidatus Eubacterium avistercoris]|uniref:Ankyrin repeat domain-containing protein n=1 Tax=Candidatus Eubacterium avistercoris TaxID=2838567 RepID=A0A9D2D1W5_9FIRM|nr:ankyrin repeat domain-containing protein [Candidatus Eubacterium avistercoris]
MKKRKRCVKIIGILMVAGLLLLSGCDSLTKITKLTADEKLKVAIIDRRKETLKEAIEDKADVNKLPYALGEMTDNGQYERNPLRLSFWNWVNQDMIKMLLDAGADVNAYDADGCPVFFYSAWIDEVKWFLLMADYDPDLTLKNTQGESILEYYINTDESGLRDFFPRKDMVELLIKSGTPVTEKTLEYAKQYKAYHILDLLYPGMEEQFSEMQSYYLEGDIGKANEMLKWQKTADKADLAVAAVYGNRETIEILNQKQVDFYEAELNEKSLLELAAWNRNLEAVSAMLETCVMPADFDIQILETAIYRNDDVELMQYLCDTDRIAIADIREDELYYFVEAGALKTVEYLLKHGYQLSEGGWCGAQLMHVAIFEENEEMAELLLKYGLDPNGEYADDPAWIYACDQGNTEILDLLLEYGADLEQYGELAMRQAIDYCNPDVIELLTEKGVKITEDLYQFSQDDIPSDHVREYVKQLYEQQHE